jgi:hypothetical protein
VKQKEPATKALEHWKTDSDLASVRGAAIDDLAESERAGWRKLWDEVDALLERAR